MDDFAGTKWKNLTGAARWSDGTEMVTLDYSHLTSVLWGVCKGFQARLDEVKPGRPSGGRRSHKKHGRRPQTNHQGRLRGSPHRFRQHSADAAAGPGARPQHRNQDRPQRGYNSFVPLEPMNQLQVDLADMKAFAGKPYPFMLVAIDALTKKVAAEPLKDRLASTTAAGMVFQALGVPANVYSDDGSEFKRKFKELMDFWDIEKQVTRGHAYFAERIIRTIKEAMLRRVAAGAGRRGQWHLMLADVLSQINGRKHATTQVAPNLAYSDPEIAEIALRNIGRKIKVGDMVRIRVKPIESRGSYRVNEIAWSEKVYRVVSRGLAWRGGRKRWRAGISEKSPKNSAPEPRGLEVQSRQQRLQRGPRLPPPFLMLSVPLRLYSSACHALMSSFTSVRGLLGKPSSSLTFQFSNRPYHVMSLSNQRRASSARCARVAGVRRAVQISHTSSKTSCKCSVFLSSHARRRTSTSAPSSCSSRSSMRRRWCERSASSSASSRGRCLHASEGRRGSHLEQLRRVFLSIWDHSSMWRAFFLFSAFACEDFCSLPRGSRRGAPAPHAAESRGRPARAIRSSARSPRSR